MTALKRRTDDGLHSDTDDRLHSESHIRANKNRFNSPCTNDARFRAEARSAQKLKVHCRSFRSTVTCTQKLKVHCLFLLCIAFPAHSHRHRPPAPPAPTQLYTLLLFP